MACIINIPYTTSIDDLVAKGFQESRNFNGFFEGDTEKGSFNFHALGGTFSGSYKVQENTIEINMQKKPFLITCGVIETFLKIHIK